MTEFKKETVMQFWNNMPQNEKESLMAKFDEFDESYDLEEYDEDFHKSHFYEVIAYLSTIQGDEMAQWNKILKISDLCIKLIQELREYIYAFEAHNETKGTDLLWEVQRMYEKLRGFRPQKD